MPTGLLLVYPMHVHACNWLNIVIMAVNNSETLLELSISSVICMGNRIYPRKLLILVVSASLELEACLVYILNSGLEGYGGCYLPSQKKPIFFQSN